MNRRSQHINNGGRVFLPQSRMRQIRWEESVLRSRLNRGDSKHKPEDVVIVHTSCGCGGIGCQGLPTTRLKAPAPEVVVVEPKPVQAGTRALAEWLERKAQ